MVMNLRMKWDEVGEKFIQCFIWNTGKRGPNMRHVSSGIVLKMFNGFWVE